MRASDVTSHFWIAGEPFFSSTILVAPGSGRAAGDEVRVANGPVTTSFDVFDIDGVRVNSVEVEFPSDQVGVVELEPFIAGLKIQNGIRYGHLAITSPPYTKHMCRYSLHEHVALIGDPLIVRSRESCFIPLVIGGRRDHLVGFVNTGMESAQISVRLFYANRSPEWNLTIPPQGSKVISLENDLLADADDKAWEKGAMQAYVRLSSRHQTNFTCQVFERVPGETAESDLFRCVTSW
jgi:hypothetical protein